MATLQLIARNFSSENHRIEFELQSLTIAIFYKVKTKYGWETEKLFLERYTKDDYTKKLQLLIERVEEHTGLKLIKSPLKIIKNDREHQRAV